MESNKYKPTKEELQRSWDTWKKLEILHASKTLFSKFPRLQGFTIRYIGPNDLRVILTIHPDIHDEEKYPKEVEGLPVVLEKGLFDYA
jgi:hypothetical protein